MSTRLLRDQVPQEETWDLTDLFATRQEWETELAAVQEDVKTVTQYKGNLADSAVTLLHAAQAFEAFQKRLIRVETYASLKVSADGADPVNQADAARVSSALANVSAKLTFFESELLTVPAETIQQFIQEESALVTYQKMFDDLMEKKPYTLSPQIEETLAALAEVHEAPSVIYERSKSSDMTFDPITDANGNERPMSEALYEDRYEISEDTEERRSAYDSFIKTLEHYKHTYAATYATEVNKQITMAHMRGYDSVTDMLLQPQEVTRDMYDNQLDVIQKELAPYMRRYAQLVKEDYGLDELHFCDLKAPLDPTFNPATTFDETKTMILDALGIMGPEYKAIIEKGLSNRWIDRSDNVGKQSGAFCASPYGVHPYILITWTDKMRGAFTLAHELGHAAHFHLAGQHQALINTEPSTYFVEAPSTMNELLLANHLMDKTDDKRMKRWVISQLLGTYYHNFVTHLLEAEFQRRVYNLAENGTPLTADVLCQQKKAVIQSFWGDTVKVDDGAGLTWMRQPHYYMGLYPYTYSAGLTVSSAMAQKIRSEGQPAVEEWLNVLRAGGTLKPLDLIKKTGIDMSKPDAIRTAVDYVGSLIDELETE